MKFILGTKKHMSEVFAEDGGRIPVTVISAGPVTVLGQKSKKRDGYDAVLIGYGETKEQRVSKAVRGKTKKHGIFKHLKEFRLGESDGSYEEGALIDADAFEPGESVHVSGITKGKGFQGVVKRHGFHGGRRSHGQKHSEREPGSIGATGPQRVFKGTRMAGRMGGNRVTVQKSRIISVDKEKNELLISGAVPGRRGTLLEIRSA